MFHTPTDPPDVTSFPVSLQRNAAEYADFSCTVTGLPIPIVQWSRTPSSQILSQELGKFDISTQIDDSSLTGPHSVTTRLIVLNLTITDQETYTCSGLNPLNIENFIGAQSSASASLFVNGKIYCTVIIIFSVNYTLSFPVPPFVSAATPSPSVALWGRRFELTFIITGFPTITPDNITWEFLPDSERDLETLSSSDRHMFSDNRHSLTLNPVRLEDAGRYRLTAINNGGTATAYIDISVLGKFILKYIYFFHLLIIHSFFHSPFYSSIKCVSIYPLIIHLSISSVIWDTFVHMVGGLLPLPWKTKIIKNSKTRCK